MRPSIPWASGRPWRPPRRPSHTSQSRPSIPSRPGRVQARTGIDMHMSLLSLDVLLRRLRGRHSRHFGRPTSPLRYPRCGRLAFCGLLARYVRRCSATPNAISCIMQALRRLLHKCMLLDMIPRVNTNTLQEQMCRKYTFVMSIWFVKRLCILHKKC